MEPFFISCFFCFKSSPHLLLLFKRMLLCRLTVKLQTFHWVNTECSCLANFYFNLTHYNEHFLTQNLLLHRTTCIHTFMFTCNAWLRKTIKIRLKRSFQSNTSKCLIFVESLLQLWLSASGLISAGYYPGLLIKPDRCTVNKDTDLQTCQHLIKNKPVNEVWCANCTYYRVLMETHHQWLRTRWPSAILSIQRKQQEAWRQRECRAG